MKSSTWWTFPALRYALALVQSKEGHKAMVQALEREIARRAENS